jgi:hypothetical protein
MKVQRELYKEKKKEEAEQELNEMEDKQGKGKGGEESWGNIRADAEGRWGLEITRRSSRGTQTDVTFLWAWLFQMF